MTAPLERPRVPPGPPGEFSLEELRSSPLAFVAGLVARYGDVVRYRAPGWCATVLNNPRDVKHVLLDRFPNYVKEGTPDVMMLRPMLGNGLLTSDGAEWERQRRLLHPVFQRQQVERLASHMTAATSELVEEWARARAGTVVEMGREMSGLTLRIVARALFGFDIRDDVEGFAAAMEVLNERTGHLGPDEGPGMGYAEALDVVRTVVWRVVVERLTADAPGDDALALLLESSQGDDAPSTSDLLDQVLTLLLAGHETTAKALAWVAYLLHQHPDAERRLVEETRLLGGRAPSVADTHQMTWTWAVLQEALRLYPPIWLTSRLAAEDDEIRGFHIPAGTLVVFSPYLLHRRSDGWVEPERFRPERFLDERELAAISAYSYIPFGGGPRQCIGRQFASLELRLVLPMIYQRFRLELVEGHPVVPQALVTLRPEHGLPMTLHER